jgi:hypothetical protein
LRSIFYSFRHYSKEKDMTEDQVDKMQVELSKLVDEAFFSLRTRAMFERLLIQAVMTAGGSLAVDPQKGKEAGSGKYGLIVGSGVIELEEKHGH